MSRKGASAEIARVTRFSVVGIVATAVHLFALLILAGMFGMGEQLANFLAFCTALGVSFLGHYHFTFRSSAAYQRVGPRFLLVMAIGYLGSVLMLELLSEAQAMPPFLRLLIASLMIPILSYLANRFLVFKDDV